MCIVCIVSRLVFRHASHTHTHIWAETDPLAVLMSEAERPSTCGGGSVGGHERLVPASVVKSIFACLCRRRDQSKVFSAEWKVPRLLLRRSRQRDNKYNNNYYYYCYCYFLP